jgi:hypothetical protein
LNVKQPLLYSLLACNMSILSVTAIALIFRTSFLALALAWLESGAVTTAVLMYYYRGRQELYEKTIASLELKPLGVSPVTEEAPAVPRGTRPPPAPKSKPLGLDDL